MASRQHFIVPIAPTLSFHVNRLMLSLMRSMKSVVPTLTSKPLPGQLSGRQAVYTPTTVKVSQYSPCCWGHAGTHRRRYQNWANCVCAPPDQK